MGHSQRRQLWQRLPLLTALTCLIRSFGVAEASVTDERVDLEEQYAAVSNGSLLWLQRPNLYFGMKARVQGDSPLFGLAWFGAHDYSGLQKLRHSCEQADNMAGYNWLEHDGRIAGTQVINDIENNVQIKVYLLKTPSGSNGGSWAARIGGQPLDPSRPSRTSLITYYGLESLGNLQLDSQEDEGKEGIDGTIKLTGSVQSLGGFSFRQVEVSNSGPPSRHRHWEEWGNLIDRTAYAGLSVPMGQAWQAKGLLQQEMSRDVQKYVDKYGQEDLPDPALLFSLSNTLNSGSNFYAFQKVYEGPFHVDVFYDPATDTVQAPKLETAGLTAGLQASTAAFQARFDKTFYLSSKGFDSAHVAYAQSLTSSMLGGIGYFYGTSIVDKHFRHEYDTEDDEDDEDGEGYAQQKDPKPELVPARGLYTATPSRSFFPRGFYWDEGFHLLVVGAWDNDLSLDILRSWVNLIDEHGWVGREQILGEEARSKVPQEFQTQYPAYGNPPTLVMGITSFIKRLNARTASGSLGSVDDPFGNKAGAAAIGSVAALLSEMSSTASPAAIADTHLASPALAKAFLTSIYPKLRLHYDWFRSTQRGQIREWGRDVSGSKTEAYRWRGRSMDHVLTSGLDDYPRAKPPHVAELHVDLMSWMIFFTRTMKEISNYIGETEDYAKFSLNEKAMLTNLDELHWSEEDQMYCDVSVDNFDDSIHVCHQGYISIFPFLLGLLPPSSPHLGPMLQAIRDPERLWSEYGIRSLSKSHPLYGQGENYWRGPVWIPLNYLALQSLYNIYAKAAGPHQHLAAQIYDELRTNIIENTFKEYQRTGFAWEQYDANNGQGSRSHPFTGWTSLVTLIMAEQY